MRRFTMKWLTTMLMLCVIGLGGCVRDVRPYSNAEAVYIKTGEPAPFDGWLLSDADLEVLLKAAEEGTK
jgi:hypothetical protein